MTFNQESNKEDFTERGGFEELIRHWWLKVKQKSIWDGLMNKWMVGQMAKGRAWLGNHEQREKGTGNGKWTNLKHSLNQN